MGQRLFVIHLLLALFVSQCMFDATQTNNNTTNMQDTDVWIGTYTRKEGHVDGKGDGIYRYSRRDSSWQLAHTTEQIPNPSFLTLSPDGRYLYAVSETGPDVDTTGYVYAYAIESGSLRFLNRQPSYSFAPCHLSIRADGKQLFVTNYVGGVLVRYPILADGRIDEASDKLVLSGNSSHARQESSHPHSVTISPDGSWVMVADLGTDFIHSFSTAATNWKAGPEISLPPGSGPRHMAFHPTAPYAYSINELNSTVTAFHYTAENGALNIIEHYPTLPAAFTDNNLSADIHLSPNGQFLYVSNRGHNSIAGFRVDVETGRLSPIGHTETQGDHPRNFAIHPSGTELWVANQNSDNVVVFTIAPQTGQLSLNSVFEAPTPVCLVTDKK